MNTINYDKQCVKKYLILVFVIAWIMQTAIAFLYLTGLGIIGQSLMSVLMFVPAFVTLLIAKQYIKNIGFKIKIKGNIKYLLFSFFVPVLLTAIGALLFFLVFPKYFDLSGEYMIASVGETALAQLEAQGLTYTNYILLSIVECVTFAPIINMLFAAGEEVGWRGLLYPQLKAKYGENKGRIVGGVIWGMWHWPLIFLIGYEYGFDYLGFPIVGMLLFCVITIILGIICDYLYEKTEMIWTPALFHGSLNAAATVPMAVCAINVGSARLLGPAPVGIISVIPFAILAILIMKKKKMN